MLWIDLKKEFSIKVLHYISILEVVHKRAIKEDTLEVQKNDVILFSIIHNAANKLMQFVTYFGILGHIKLSNKVRKALIYLGDSFRKHLRHKNNTSWCFFASLNGNKELESLWWFFLHATLELLMGIMKNLI